MLVELADALAPLLGWDAARREAELTEATEILNDSRLQPDETRALEYSFTAAGVGIVRTELLYHLLTPPVLEMFGDKLPEEVKKARVAASAEERFES